MKCSKKIMMITTILIVLLILPIPTSAAGVVYESESNNYYNEADLTLDDNTNYGTINTASDIDWWKITFDSDGMANIYLGSVPSGCDYKIEFFAYNSINRVAYSDKSSNSNEFMQCRVSAGYSYYVKVSSSSGYSDSYYRLRIKNYDFGNAKIFTTDCIDINTRPSATNALPYIWDMGYGGQEYLNNTVGPAYDAFPSSWIFVVRNHGGNGRIRFDGSSTNITRLFAKNYSGISSSNRSIESYSSNALSGVRLAIFLGCETGGTHSTYGNLVDMALNKGAAVALGWNKTIKTGDGNKWTEVFFEECTNGYCIEQTLFETRLALQNESLLDYETIIDIYYGASNISGVAM